VKVGSQFLPKIYFFQLTLFGSVLCQMFQEETLKVVFYFFYFSKNFRTSIRWNSSVLI
jgi:hypothetical protein